MIGMIDGSRAAQSPRLALAPMFHVKHRLALALVAMATVAFLATGCTAGVASPHGWAPPVAAANGLLLVQSATGRLAAVNTSGATVAQYELRGATTTNFIGRTSQAAAAPLYAAPLVDGDAVYVVSYGGTIARLKLGNGSLTAAWETHLAQNIVATPILRGNRLYVSTENGHLVALDATSGKTLTSSRPTSGRVWGAPVLQQNRILIGTLDSSELIAVNAETGAIEWKQTLAGATAADLLVDGELLVVASFDRTIHALGLADGTEKWRFQGDGWFVSRPLATPQGIYMVTMRGSVYALDRTGQSRWHFRRDGLEFRAAPMLVGDTLVAADRNGVFVGLDAATGTEKWTRTVDQTFIDADGALLESALFYVTTDRRLLRVDPASGDIKAFNVQPPSGDGK
ncbi:MAG: hypothetical protein EXR68_03685 [Dehalococcoidia bacterium]|nr:hypothetical protein [Dehalococcoidia bacterium]